VLFTPNRISFDQVSLQDSVIDSIPPTQWKTGMLIGAGVGGAGLGILSYALCEGLSETDESCLRLALLGAAAGAVLGGIVGALIGGQVPKGTQSEE
jgi:ABC-type Fe3+-siderophore transport system permease subunit